MSSALNEDPEFTLYQQELDAAFHTQADPFPAGTPEHAELLAFVCKLHKLRSSRLDTADDDDSGAQFHPQLAEKLGLPSSYDVRFRVSASLAVPPERLGAAVRAIARRMCQRASVSISSRSNSGVGSRFPMSSSGGSHGVRDRASGTANVTTDMAEAASKMVEDYRRLLPWFEDFFQKRQVARLRKLQADRAALPAAGFREAIVSALASSQALVVAGDTGCGKSTQIPQFLVASGYRRIAVTQPRRISAVSLARRVAIESCDAHGSSVAYKVRFSSSVAADSRIVFCTEGILLRELVGDSTLAAYDVVVLDEVHERHLTTDFLLALLRALLFQRPDLRLVLMSATINCTAFADYFGGAPIVQIPGRLYPIRLVYVPPETDSEETRRRDAGRRGGGASSSRNPRGNACSRSAANPTADQIDPAPYLRLLQRIDSEVPSNQRGDLLIFVAGTADITALCTALAPYAEQTRRWIMLPLHAALPLDAQEKVFDVSPEGVRKAIIATNIAETSLTIDGVRFVADSGRAKEMIHDVASGGGSLQEGWISRASADQRKGRAGRTGPGICYRMFSEAQYNDMRAFSAPEIARVRLEAVVLSIKAMAGSVMDPRVFGFIDPPPPDRLEASIANLKQIGAVSVSEALTPLGAVLSLLPVDVAIGKLLVLGCIFGLAGPALTLAAALSVQSPFLKLGDEEQDQEAKAARAALISPHGDALTLLNVFEAWLAVKHGAGGSGAGAISGGASGARGASSRSGGGTSSTRWCRRHGLAEARLYEMAKLRAQFAELLTDAGILRAGGGSALSAGQDAASRHHRYSHGRREGRRRGSGSLRGAELHAAKRRLRDMQAERERQRGRKVLRVEGGASRRREGGGGDGGGGNDSDGSSASSSSSSSSSGEEELERLHDLDLRVHVDVGAMATECSRPLSAGDLGLLRHLLAASLYPRVAVADEANLQRREQDCRFHTAQVSDLVIHPGSSLFGFSNNLPRGQVLLYQELIETRRQYLSGVTPLWSFPALLLVARRLDCDSAASRWLVDGWLLLRLHDGSGPKALQMVLELRGGASHLIGSRLRAANLAALSAVQTVEDNDDNDNGHSNSVGSQSFQRGYSVLAAALPEELRPMLSEVMTQQAAWREAAAAQRHQQHEREQRRRRRTLPAGGTDARNDENERDGDGDEGKDEGELHYKGWAADVELEETLARRLALDMWPCRYSLERLPPGNKVTAQFILTELQLKVQPQPPDGQRSEPGSLPVDARQPPPPPRPPPAAAVASGVCGAVAAGVEVDALGMPYKCAGTWLTPWLRYGSLRSFESAMALHALQPALRKPWMCPGCGLRLVGTFSEVRDHVISCDAVQGVDAQVVETMGYAQANSTAGGAAASGADLTNKQRAGGSGGGGGGLGAGDSCPQSTAGTGSSSGVYDGGDSHNPQDRVDEVGVGDSLAAADSMDKLERYLASPITWCRRRTVSSVRTAQGSEYCSRSRIGRRVTEGGGGRQHSDTDPGSALPRQQEPDRPPSGLERRPSGAEVGVQGLVEALRNQEAIGKDGGAAGVGPPEMPPPATGRPYKCPICSLEATMTPPQILLHKRQH